MFYRARGFKKHYMVVYMHCLLLRKQLNISLAKVAKFIAPSWMLQKRLTWCDIMVCFSGAQRFTFLLILYGCFVFGIAGSLHLICGIILLVCTLWYYVVLDEAVFYPPCCFLCTLMTWYT